MEKAGAKHQCKDLRGNKRGIVKPANRQLAFQGDVKRFSDLRKNSQRAESVLRDVVNDSIAYTEHAKRKSAYVLNVDTHWSVKDKPVRERYPVEAAANV